MPKNDNDFGLTRLDAGSISKGPYFRHPVARDRRTSAMAWVGFRARTWPRRISSIPGSSTAPVEHLGGTGRAISRYRCSWTDALLASAYDPYLFLKNAYSAEA